MTSDRIVDRSEWLVSNSESLPFYTTRPVPLRNVNIPTQRRLFNHRKDAIDLPIPYHLIDAHNVNILQNRVNRQKDVMGWDTETIGGRCKLLANSSNEYLFPESFDEILEFLVKVKSDRYINMFYNLKYDVHSLLSYLDLPFLVDLHTIGQVQYKDYLLEYIPKKRFRFRYNKTWYSFYDILQFYYQSLDKASKKYLNKTKIDMSYDDLADPEFWDNNRQDIIDYCIYDAVLCRDLGEFAKTQFNQYGLDFNNPISTASLSEQFAFRYARIPRYSLPVVQEYGYYSYQAGWFEQFQRGYFEQVYKLDINSAYPHIMQDFPDISKGHWETVPDNIDSCNFGFVYAKVWGKQGYVQPLSIPYTSSLKYPVTHKHLRYLTLEEYRTFLEYDLVNIEPINYMLFFPSTDYKPFSYLRNFYTERNKMKRRNDPRQLPLKILMNSTYGKLIQMINSLLDIDDYKAGQMFLPVYASYTTAGCRNMIREKLLKEDITPLAIYTDCIIMEDKPNDNSTELGGWSIEKSGEMVALGSGVYSVRDGNKEDYHLRGVNKNTVSSLFELLEQNPSKTHIPLTINRPIGLGEFVSHRIARGNNWLNQWIDFPKDVNINFDTKRVWNNDFSNSAEALRSRIDSKPINLLR